MSSTPQLYRKVANRFKADGWTKREFRDKHGRCCLVQALLDELGLHDVLPADVLGDLNDELNTHKDYVALCGRFMVYGVDIQTLLAKWNDTMFRKSNHVVAMLESLANRLEAERVLQPSLGELGQPLDRLVLQPVG